MGITILSSNDKLTKEIVADALEHYPFYIKITIDIKQELIAVGGQYHFDAEQMLLKDYNSEQKDVWGGGYEINTKEFRTDAMVNVRPFHNNSQMVIRDPEIERKFIELAQRVFKNIDSLL